jgi:hypothetical protein
MLIRRRHLNVLLLINTYNGAKFYLSFLEISALLFVQVIMSHSADWVIQSSSFQFFICVLQSLFNSTKANYQVSTTKDTK